MPRVSVLMPVYNTKLEYLHESIDSILAQTFTDFELLILNDCSTDHHVEEVVKSYSDPRIVYTSNEHNLGISGSRNRLLDMAQGEYLAVMDHDDISLPERFEKQVLFLDSHSNIGVVGSQAFEITSETNINYPCNDIEIKKALMLFSPFCHPAVMFRASVLKHTQTKYNELFSPAEDYNLFCSLIKHTQFANIPEVLFHYRNWAKNTTHLQLPKMLSATLGIQEIARRENPELWAMAKHHVTSLERIKILGVPFFIYKTQKSETWKLFNILTVYKKTFRRNIYTNLYNNT